MATLAARQRIAQDTLARCQDITATTPGASLLSTFIPAQLPPLPSSSTGAAASATEENSVFPEDVTLKPHRVPVNPNFPPKRVTVVNSDSFQAAREIVDRVPHAKGKIAVLNLASDERPGGGWEYSLSRTQEEALCYSSTLYPTLLPSYYPFPNTGPGSVSGIFSPSVVIFKDTLSKNCIDLSKGKRAVVSVITVAAPRYPAVKGSPDGGEMCAKQSDLDDLRRKIRLVLRMAGWYGQDYLVLGAMGCGAYGNPPHLVASEMRAALLEPEFRGWFKEVVFAVYSAGREGNLDVFKSAFDGVDV